MTRYTCDAFGAVTLATLILPCRGDCVIIFIIAIKYDRDCPSRTVPILFNWKSARPCPQQSKRHAVFLYRQNLHPTVPYCEAHLLYRMSVIAYHFGRYLVFDLFLDQPPEVPRAVCVRI